MLPTDALAYYGLETMSPTKTAFLFPGQGSQAVGMGVAMAASHQQAKQVFDEVNDPLVASGMLSFGATSVLLTSAPLVPPAVPQ